jgi:hypothetical protein
MDATAPAYNAADAFIKVICQVDMESRCYNQHADTVYRAIPWHQTFSTNSSAPSG